MSEFKYPNERIEEFAGIARQHGVAITHVIGEFAYTNGFESNYDHPEVIPALPLNPQIGYSLLEMVHDIIKAGGKIELDKPYDSFLHGDMPVVFKGVPYEQSESHTTVAHAVAQAELGRSARVYQMVLPDRERRLPWDAGYSMTAQKLLYSTLR
ncbi:DUF4262 domain-containing protein [Chromobacterium sp. ASV23]|uniref:DUF4262 domain-containing protein n=1 Tax=Chromobacterium sp. ASV23 TaxID=2795110 RepID=UPI0018ECBE62|nr:DUF4262 domain-containing protein [Chromobacterium sp. ASV23]